MILEATLGEGVDPESAAASFFGFMGVAVSLSFASKWLHKGREIEIFARNLWFNDTFRSIEFNIHECIKLLWF